jgi:hypothetical protein
MKTVLELYPTGALPPLYKIVIDDKPPPNTGPRTYNRPTCTEVAAIVCGTGLEGDNAEGIKRCLQIHLRDGPIQKIYSNHSSYDPMAYVPYHIHGTRGWTFNDVFKHRLGDDGIWQITDKQVTAMDYYCYKGHSRDIIRKREQPILQDVLFYGGPLMQQFWTDQWIKIEEERLRWVKLNKKN